MIFGWDSFYFISDWLKKLTTHLLNSQMNPSSVENVNFLQDLIKHWELIRQNTIVQVNLCQKRSFFHQLTHNMTTDCSWNDKFSTRKIQVQNMLCTKIVLKDKTKQNKTKQKTIFVHNMFWTCIFPAQLKLEIKEQFVVILWVNWPKNECFWQRFTLYKD